jgi:hypothetical protein
MTQATGGSSMPPDPIHIIASVLEENLIVDPRAVAEVIVARLHDAGFVISPA